VGAIRELRLEEPVRWRRRTKEPVQAIDDSRPSSFNRVISFRLGGGSLHEHMILRRQFNDTLTWSIYSMRGRV